MNRALPVLVLVVVAPACSGRASAPAPAPTRLDAPPAPPYLAYISTASDATFQHVALAPLGSPAGAYISPLACTRVHIGGGRGVCLSSTSETDEGKPVTRWWADIFDARFTRLQRFALTGPPSRVRVAANGRLAASTVFEQGHSYAENGFSTRTTIFDLESQTLVGDLEQFETRRNGAVIRADDFNFWGVTFARDGDTFFATLDTAGISHLVKGSVRARTMEVMRPGVECPSLSPDGARLGFKKRLGTRTRGWWQLAVVRLDTMQETIVSHETRSIDDQVEWLDNDRVMYHLTGGSTAADLWTVRVDDSAAPVRLLPDAYSPAVVRP